MSPWLGSQGGSTWLEADLMSTWLGSPGSTLLDAELMSA
jgi:hypothetical protein